jgi:DNA-binding Lrp family transcriptional regulator
MKNLSENHRKLLEILLTQQCAKVDIPKISRLSGMYRPTITSTLKKLQEQGYFKGFVPVIGENIGYWVFDSETPPHGQFPNWVLKDPLVRQIYTGINRSLIFYSGSKEQMGNFQSNLKGEYGQDVMTDAILDVMIKSVPYLQKR